MANMEKKSPLEICQGYFVILLHKLPIDLVREIIHPTDNVFMNENCISSIYIGQLQTEIRHRLQTMIDIFIEWQASRRIARPFVSILDPFSKYHNAYRSIILSEPGKYCTVHCPIETDRCEIPMLIHPPMYDFPTEMPPVSIF